MKKTLNEEKLLKEHIKQIVRDSLSTLMENYYFESDDNDSDYNDYDYEKNDEKDKDNDKKSNKKRNKNDGPENETEKDRKRRIQVEDFLLQPGINPAQYFYKLFGVEPVEGNDTNEMKDARGLGEKKLHHETNSDGYPYYFSSEEVNHLYSLMSSNELS